MERLSNSLSVWRRLQENAEESYINDPEHNLSVGNRADCAAFGRFCGFHGLVLDIGCGPQPWPAYFSNHSDSTRFVGIDVSPGLSTCYPKVKGMGEALPFRNRTFDHVVFATSIDHLLDPVAGLIESRRVCRGQINIWIGEKNGTSECSSSPRWYENLTVPDGAEDKFHLKRLTGNDIRHMVREAQLHVLEEEVQVANDIRKNRFYRVA